jgi:ribosomal protein L11 methyltransferase
MPKNTKKEFREKQFMPKTWVELAVEIHPSLVEAVSSFLIEQGSPGVIQEELPGPAHRKKERIIAYFPNDRGFRAKGEKIRSFLLSVSRLQPGSFAFHPRVIKEERWAENWKSNFKPLRITPRLVVKPPWEEYRKQRGELVIEIDPGMAFGTGTHPSTQMCLQALEEIMLSSPHPPSMLDVGTGSGILAIAARKVGVRQVLAIDIDPVAIDCARKNAALNNINRGIDFRVGSPDGLRRNFAIIVANLLPQELLKVAPFLPKRMSSGGTLIISGLLRGQEKESISAFAEQSLEILRSRESRGWACLVLRRRVGKKNGGK